MSSASHYLVLTVPALLFRLWGKLAVHCTYQRFAEVGVQSGYSGAKAAQTGMQSAGVQNVRIKRHGGVLSNHYDPLAKGLRLSPLGYDGQSISSDAWRPTRAGRSIHGKVGYLPLVWRSALVPLSTVGIKVRIFPFMAGLLCRRLSFTSLLISTSMGLFAAVVVFQLSTLPTEFNASSRAKAVLASTGIVLIKWNAAPVKRVLDAAVLTEVAAAAASSLQLINLVLRQRS
jgi:Zn-dependent membrane protease YugP